MIARLGLAVLLNLLGALSAAAQAVAEPPVLILESYGVYCALEGSSRKVAAPGTVLGYVHITEADTAATVVTTRVPAALGIGFGVALRAAGDQSDFIAEFRVTHPAGASGARITERWTTSFSPQAASLNRFRFEFPEELHVGLWVMEVYRDETPVFRQAFEVVPPEAAGDILEQCSGFVPVS